MIVPRPPSRTARRRRTGRSRPAAPPPRGRTRERSGDGGALRDRRNRPVGARPAPVSRRCSATSATWSSPRRPTSTPIVTEHRPNRTADLVIDLLGRSSRRTVDHRHRGRAMGRRGDCSTSSAASSATIDRPWLIVVLRRDGEGGFVPDGGERIDVAPLSDQVIRRLAIAATEATPLRPSRDRPHRHPAAGSPQFVEELSAARVAPARSRPFPTRSTPSSRRPGRRARRRWRGGCSRTAAVLGRSFRRPVLDALLAAEDREPRRTATWEQLDRFLEPDGDTRLRFRNGLVRDVVYEALPYRTRARTPPARRARRSSE